MEWISSSFKSIAKKVTSIQESNSNSKDDQDSLQHQHEEEKEEIDDFDNDVLDIKSIANQLKINSIRSLEFSRLKGLIKLIILLLFMIYYC